MDKAAEYLKAIKLPSRYDQHHKIPTIGAGVALLYISYRLLTRGSKSITGEPLKEIPVPGSCYPYVGHLFSLGELPGDQITEWHKQFGPILKIKMGQKTWIMVSDPMLAHKIFVGGGSQTSHRPYGVFNYDYYSKGGKGVVFSQPGPDFKKNRAAVLSVLAPKQMENFMSSIQKESMDFANRLIDFTTQNGSVNPVKLLELNSMNVIFQALFGRKFESVEDPEFCQLSDMVERAMEYAGLEQDLPNFLPVLSVFKCSSTRLKRDPIFKKMIEEAYNTDGPNVVKMLDQYDMSLEEKIILMSDLHAAGTDTVATTLSWIFVIMCHYPTVQKRAIDEIDAFFKKHGHVPTFADRLEVPLCISIMKECMRFKPTSAFGLPHSVTEDFIVDGYLIPKDATIISSMNAMHNDPERFQNPEKFDPERFMGNLKTMQSAANGSIEYRDHFNFGWGRRICPGIYLAEAEMFSAFVQLFSRASIEPSDEGLPDLHSATNAGLVLQPHPYKLKFVRRPDAAVQ
ncbi:cytochrome P450 [Blakeslea trispora]|nr:cytochrome P450 [Blakeslea trispora]